MLGLLIVLCAALGLAIGSFANVVIYRVPPRRVDRVAAILLPIVRDAHPGEGQHSSSVMVVAEGSLQDLQSTDFGPVSIGGGLLRSALRRMRHAVWLPMGSARLPGPLRGASRLSWIDIERMLLPKRIVYPLTLLVAALLALVAGATANWHAYLVGVACAVGWFIVFFAMNLASPRILGFGDVRLSLVLGLALGWLGVGYVLLGFFAANLIGALLGIALITTKRMTRTDHIPYGVFLACGCAVAVFAGPEPATTFHALHTLERSQIKGV